MFISNNCASFHLWWKKYLVKHHKVTKYYENDCRTPALSKMEIFVEEYHLRCDRGLVVNLPLEFFLIGIHSMQGWAVTTRHGVTKKTTKIFMHRGNQFRKNRPGWERCAFTLAGPHKIHSKNTGVLCCMPKTLYGVLSHLFLIHSFSTLLIILFVISLIKLTVQLDFIYFSSFIVTFAFSCTCYLLNRLRHS